jgi:hypothetical protein
MKSNRKKSIFKNRMKMLKSCRWQAKKAVECERKKEFTFAWYHWSEAAIRARYLLPQSQKIVALCVKREDEAFNCSK